MGRASEVCFARTRAQLECRFDGGFCQRPLFRSVLTQSVQCVVGTSDQALRCEERGIACQGLIEQIDPCMDIRHLHATEANVKNEVLSPAVEFKGSDICGWTLLDRTLLGGREFRLQLVGNAFGNLTLNGEDVSEIAIVSLRPKMRIVAGIDQLRVHAHTIAYALYTALDQTCNPKLLADFAQVALGPRFVLHHRSTADHLQVGDFGEVSQNFVLHAISEKGVVGIAAQILERQNRDAFFRNGGSVRYWRSRGNG